MTDSTVTGQSAAALIAASIEDVQALLASNRNISVAFLARRIRDIEGEMRERFRQMIASRDGRIESLEKAVAKLEERLQLAGVKFREMQDAVDAVEKGNQPLTKET